jgi:hypothetical protein
MSVVSKLSQKLPHVYSTLEFDLVPDQLHEQVCAVRADRSETSHIDHEFTTLQFRSCFFARRHEFIDPARNQRAFHNDSALALAVDKRDLQHAQLSFRYEKARHIPTDSGCNRYCFQQELEILCVVLKMSMAR